MKGHGVTASTWLELVIILTFFFGKGITAIYNQSANISDETISACHSAGVLAIGWCVTYTSFGYTEETAKAEILRAISAGMDGMTIDQWTCANLVSDSFDI